MSVFNNCWGGGGGGGGELHLMDDLSENLDFILL